MAASLAALGTDTGAIRTEASPGSLTCSLSQPLLTSCLSLAVAGRQGLGLLGLPTPLRLGSQQASADALFSQEASGCELPLCLWLMEKILCTGRRWSAGAERYWSLRQGMQGWLWPCGFQDLELELAGLGPSRQ